MPAARMAIKPAINSRFALGAMPSLLPLLIGVRVLILCYDKSDVEHQDLPTPPAACPFLALGFCNFAPGTGSSDKGILGQEAG